MINWAADWFESVAVKVGKDILTFVLNNAFEVALITAIGTGILIIAGSTKARKWLYWEVIGYVILEFLRGVIL